MRVVRLTDSRKDGTRQGSKDVIHRTVIGNGNRFSLKGDTPEDSNQNGDRRIDRTQAGVDKGSNHADFVADGSLA